MDEDRLNKALGQRLKTFRVVAGKKQRDLAAAMDFSPNYLSMVEAGRREPSLKFLRRFCSALKVPLSVLFAHECESAEEKPGYARSWLSTIDEINEILLRERFPEN